MVLATQKWLNKTYGSVSGFSKVPENGQTGWVTIYGLREGLQHELGLTTLGEGFGEQTKAALAKVIGTLREGVKNNIVKLTKGAFWCKGISSGELNTEFDADLTAAITVLQTNAGIKGDGILTVNLMAALFDMSAFVLVGDGDPNIREMQQHLNSKYSADLGIMPCDGIYQRSTNTALIYALQRLEGMDAATANGNYGPGTIARTPTVSQGATGELVRIIQYGLYVNGFYKGVFDGIFDSEVSDEIIAFRKFMKLPPYTGVADLTVIKGLLTSNGNTNRDSNAFDTATPLTASAITKFKNAGFEIVGRYLTGTVGVGSNKRAKHLTVEEIKLITAGGLRIFPIYEDGGYEESYFTATQGLEDGFIAVNAARKLGFPKETTIYFAVDVDIQEGNIDGTVIPYLKNVVNALSGSGYSVGVYGTRNVCLHAAGVKGVKYSFVADMSYGWSGNLGFRMPKNWAFDQFTEYVAGSTGIDIDQDASSGRDLGVANFAKVATASNKQALQDLWPDAEYSFGKEYPLLNTPWIKASVELSDSYTKPNGSSAIVVKNGQIDGVDMDKLLDSLGVHTKPINDLILGKANELSFVSGIEAGQVAVKNYVTTNGNYAYEVSFIAFETKTGPLEQALTITLKFEFNLIKMDGWDSIAEKVSSVSMEILAFAAAIIALGVIIAELPAEAATVVGASVVAVVNAIEETIIQLLPSMAVA